MQMLVIDGRIFIVQNLYADSAQGIFGTLAIELNVSRLFHDIQPQIAEETAIYLNQVENRVMIQCKIKEEWQKKMEKELLQQFGRKESYKRLVYIIWSTADICEAIVRSIII